MTVSKSFSPQNLLEEIEGLTRSPDILKSDDKTRIRLRDAAWKLSLAAEVPGDTIHRTGSLPLQLAMVRIGIEVGLFDALSKGEGRTQSTAQLAEATQVDPALMRRFLRYYASFGMITQNDVDQFSASNISNAMVPDGLKAGIEYFFETISGTFMQYPRFLREVQYTNAVDPLHCPWQLAHNTDQPPFLWLQSHPDHFNYFIRWMTANREGLPIWLDVFPFQEKLCKGATPETPVFVDIGGANGHQCIALRAHFPNLVGRVILQDTPQVIGQVPPMEGIEPMIYDFWTPQPIKGARAYYLRNILHDWPDDKCRLILQNIMSAMTKDSVIVIDEMVLPEIGANWRATQLDITMATCLAAQERSRSQWYELLESVGLSIVDIHVYTDELQDSVIMAVPK